MDMAGLEIETDQKFHCRLVQLPGEPAIQHLTPPQRRCGVLSAALLWGLLAAGAAQADTFHFSGTFTADDGLALLVVDVPGLVSTPLTALTALTLSFAQGGFAPVLSLFDGQGFLLQAGAPADPGACCEQRLAVDALPGHYTLVLSQQGNYPGATLADAFSNAGQAHYTAAYDPLLRPNATFIDIDQTQRSGFWALDLTVAGAVAVVPEPAAGWLLAAGLAGMTGLTGLKSRHRRRAAG